MDQGGESDWCRWEVGGDTDVVALQHTRVTRGEEDHNTQGVRVKLRPGSLLECLQRTQARLWGRCGGTRP